MILLYNLFQILRIYSFFTF